MDLGANGFQTWRYVILPNSTTTLPSLVAYYLTREGQEVAGSDG